MNPDTRSIVSVAWPADQQMNPCCEIALPQYLTDAEISLLLLQGATVINSKKVYRLENE